MRAPCVVGRLPLLDFAGTPIHPIAVNYRTHLRGSAAFGVVDFAENESKVGIGGLFGAEQNTIPGNSLIVDRVALKRALEQRQSSIFIQRTGRAASATTGETKTTAITAAAIRRNSIFIGQRSDLITQNQQLSSDEAIYRIDIMKITKNIGMLLLAVYLIIDGLLGFGLNLGPGIFLLYVVALAAGVCILIGK
jgi:hypothetical protein